MIEVSGGRLAYEEAGDGPDAAVFHQYNGVTASGALAQAVARHFRVKAINPRGIGESGPVRDDGDLTMSGFVEDLVAARKALGVEKWVLAGSSTGGMVALQVALADPDGVAGLVLVGTAASRRFMEGSMYDPNGPDAAEFGMRMRELMANGDTEAYMEAVFRASVYDPERTPQPPEFGAGGFSMPRMMAFGQSVAGFDVEDRLGEISCPALVICGRQDPQCPLPNSERIAAGIPAAELRIFEECGHFPYWEHAEQFRAAIDAWSTRLN
ncbi:alpha/beta fold hydrolase [Fodinicola acaciae]|uniref:alpha/beta fold hydrolase n=1 Tax=Fodinicola acaciae TaxID=2681555 RepID=UPI0013D59874|nr:alpha/beta hydrolase [Fodinicola acaciae]